MNQTNTQSPAADAVASGALLENFQAWCYGYLYEWKPVTGVRYDVGGSPFIFCEPVRRIKGKRGRLRGRHAWHLSLIPSSKPAFSNNRDDFRPAKGNHECAD